MLYTGYQYPTNLEMMSLATCPLIGYCILDIIGNSWDMIIHHISTIVITVSLHYSYNTQDTLVASKVARDLMFTEVSTVFLDFIHLGYSSIVIKILFLLSFTYFRIIQIPLLLIINSDTCYFCKEPIDFVCSTNIICHMTWSISILSLMLLNIMWFLKIIQKMLRCKVNEPSNITLVLN